MESNGFDVASTDVESVKPIVQASFYVTLGEKTSNSNPETA